MIICVMIIKSGFSTMKRGKYMVKFIHEKYESIWWLSSLLALALLIINNLTLRSDPLYIVIFIVYVVFMSVVGITNHRYKKKKQD